MSLTRNSTIGLVFGVVALVAMTWSLLGKPDPLADRHVVWAEFPDAVGVIRFDRDVRAAGVNVGKIGRIERRGSGARVQLLLDEDVFRAVRADATAELRPHTIFDGNSFIELHVGSRSAPAIGPGGLPLAHTRSYVSLDRALRVFDPRTLRALPQLVHSLRAAIGPRERRAVRQVIRELPTALPAVARWTRAAQGRTRRELDGAVRGFAQTIGSVARVDADIAPVLRSTAATSRALRGHDQALDRTLGALPATLVASRSGGDALATTVDTLRPLARDLTPALRELTPTLRELRPLLTSARPVLSRAAPFARDLQATLASAERAAAPTTTLLRALQPTLAVTHDTLVPFLLSKAANGTSIAASVAAMSASAAGTLSPVKTVQEGDVGKAGPGHGFYMSAGFLTGTQLGCAQIPITALVDRLKALELCTP
jgi:phospholipid/cholesterol/gamma-HCH transport system substrate-binding protein